MSRAALIPGFLLFCAVAPSPGQHRKDLITPIPLPRGSTLVIGFLGGWEHWNDQDRGVRKTVLRLRQRPGVYAESIENHHLDTALKLVERSLDTNGNHKLDAEERRLARIVIFGQSLGGQATVRLARLLRKRGIPVLLTVQIDSVGTQDRVIPGNVRAAANLYQRELLTFRGRSEIVAADPRQTTILENKQFYYPLMNKETPPPSGWARRSLGGGHARMEADPAVWEEVESLVLSHSRPQRTSAVK